MITFFGDIFLGSSFSVEQSLIEKTKDTKYILANYESVFDFENSKKREDKGAILISQKNYLDAFLEIFNKDFYFTLGNNHVHDLGFDGINKLKRIFNSFEQIEYSGVGLLKDVLSPYIMENNNKKIAFLPVSTDEPEVMSILATNDTEGVLDYNNPKIYEIIKDIKKKVDFFVMIPHWGKEYIKYPSYSLRKKAYDWIDAGADLVIGHHPHVIQGKESYKGKWIYYSLGNFIFPDFYTKNGILKKWNKENCHSIALNINFSNQIDINEFGTFYNTKKNSLSLSEDSLKMFDESSFDLDYSKISKKFYHSVYERELYKILHNDYSKYSKIVKLLNFKNTINLIKNRLGRN